MDIEVREISIEDLVNGYENNEDEDGSIVALDGKLDVRPPYQRSFVYDDKQRKAVIDTVLSGYPLNTMYWVEKDNGNYEILDGQQRTLSICQYRAGDFSIKDKDGISRSYDNLSLSEKEAFNKYNKFTIYICKGDPDEKYAWFKVINTAGAVLCEQELRNAAHIGDWLADAKKWFSEFSNGGKKCPARKRFGDYIKVDPVRQELLELALKWIADAQDTTIEAYMDKHQRDEDAAELKDYFLNVISWVKKLFQYDKYMKGLPWGEYYNKFKSFEYDINELRSEVDRLMADTDVTSKPGIYYYLLAEKLNLPDDERERYLSIRTFDEPTKRAVYAKQGGICPICHELHCEQEKYSIDEMQADHIVPWSKGGKTILENCQMLCKRHNGYKSDK